MIDQDKANLMARYLAGGASDEDIQRLDAWLRSDASARRELLLAAGMEDDLRRILAGVEDNAQPLPAAVAAGSADRRPTGARTQAGPRPRWRRPAFRSIVLIVLAAVGWAAAAYFAAVNHQARGRLAQLAGRSDPRPGPGRPASTPAPREEPAAPAADADKPRLHEARGLVLLLPEAQGQGQPVRLNAGSVVPEGRALWTCPWGRAGTRYADGTTVSLERSTVAAFSESDSGKVIQLQSGILAINRYGGRAQRGPMTIETPNGSVRVRNAMVAVAISDGRTFVEVGEGMARVTRAGDGEAVQAPAGHYVVVSDADTFRVVKGRLRWKLEP